MADMPLTAPAVKPANPNFSSGPCAKRPGWTVNALANALVGRSHRAKPAKARIEKAIALCILVWIAETLGARLPIVRPPRFRDGYGGRIQLTES